MLGVALALVLAAAGAPNVGAAPPDPATWSRILADVVVDEAVDYRAVRERHRADLETWLERLDGVDAERLDRADRLAFYINLYNATVVRAVAERWTPSYRPDDDGFALFHEPLVRLGGERISLDTLEHRIIRARFDEPRIHVALVCAARSCPPLADRAYTGEDLDAMLERRLRRFLEDGKRNRIDPASRTLYLSRIFDWYADDFGGRSSLSAWIDRHVDEDVAGFEVRFLPYSWELNDASR